jgi:hypothetical protein
MVDRPSDHLLARAALAGDENRRLGRRDLPVQVEDLVHGRALPDQVVEVEFALDLPPEHLGLPGQLAVLEQAGDLGEHVVEHDRLENVVRRARPERLDRALDAAVGRHHERHRLRRHLAQLPEHDEPVGAGHAEVGDDDREVVVVGGGQGRQPSTAVSTA